MQGTGSPSLRLPENSGCGRAVAQKEADCSLRIASFRQVSAGCLASSQRPIGAGSRQSRAAGYRSGALIVPGPQAVAGWWVSRSRAGPVTISEHMPDNELDRPEEFDDDDEKSPSGLDELLFVLANALRSKRSREAIAGLIEQYSQELPLNRRRKHHAMLWSYVFTVVVVAAVGVIGHFKIITSETAGTLLGAIVGALFYGRRSS